MFCPVRWSTRREMGLSSHSPHNSSNCTVAIRNLSFMQFIAMKLRFRISNLLMNEQKTAALADVRVR